MSTDMLRHLTNRFIILWLIIGDFIIYYYFLDHQYSVPEGIKYWKTKQVRPQRRLLGGKSAVEGDCISPLLLLLLLLLIRCI